MPEPLVSIIIVNWNGIKYINDCITSLLEQSFRDFEILLVDNSSSDGSVEFVERKFPDIRIIRNSTNVGFAEGNNIGIKKSFSKFVALFNPDAVADREWLTNLVTTIQSEDTIGAVSGKIFYLGDQFGKNAVFCTWPKIDPKTAIPYNFHDDEPAAKVDYLSGAAMLVKRTTIEKVGFLDSKYFMYFEETDWCARMIRSGYDLVYVPEAIAWHVVSSSISDSDKKIFFMEKNRIRFAVKNFDISYLCIFMLIFLGETMFIFIRDIRNKTFSRTKIRIKAIYWNLLHLRKTIEDRKKDLLFLKKNAPIKSYNKSLPLREIKIPTY